MIERKRKGGMFCIRAHISYHIAFGALELSPVE